MVIAAGTLWSFQALIIRQISASNPWTILFWRSLTMTPVTIAFLGWRNGGSPLGTIRRAGWPGILGGFGLVLAMAGAILAFQTTTVANAAFLFAAAPMLAAIMGHWLLGEAVSRTTAGCMAMALIGVAIMVSDGLAAGAWLGNCAALASAFGFAAFTVTLRWGHVDDSLPITVVGGLLAVMVAALAAWLAGTPLGASARDLAWCALMGVGTLAGGMILYSLGSAEVPAGQLVLLSNMEVLLAPVWVWLVMGETARAGTLAGGAVLLAAISINAFTGIRGASRLA